MQRMKLESVIAERELHSLRLGREIKVRIGIPRKTSHQDFITTYQIIGVGDEQVRFGAGLDAVQSLQLALKMIGADIAQLSKLYDLRWADRDDAGFPVE